jgi:hypothetical protein
VSLRYEEETPLEVLASALSPLNLGVYFLEGQPTVLAGDPGGIPAFPVADRKYNISFLKGSYENFPGRIIQPDWNYSQRAPRLFRDDEYETMSAQTMREQVVEYVREVILSGGDDPSRNCVVLSGGKMKVKSSPDAHEKVANLLKGLRDYHRRSVKVTFHFLEMETGLMRALAGAGPLAWGSLSEKQKTLLDEGLREGRARSVKRTKLIAFNGQKVNASVVNQRAFIRDIDVEVAQSAEVGDPIIGAVHEGMVAEVKPVLFGKGDWILMNFRTAVTEIIDPVEAFDTPHGRISLPKSDFQMIGTSVFLRDGGTVVVGGAGSLGVGKNLVLAISVKTVTEPEDNRFGASAFHKWQLRVFDIRDLTFKIPNRPGPKVNDLIGDVHAMPPMFCEESGDDPRIGERYDVDEIVELIRMRVDPESWDVGRNAIGTRLGYLVVVNTDENLKKVEALLEACRRRRMKGVEVVTRFVSLKSKDLVAILGKDVKEEGSATLTDDQLRKILDLAEEDPAAKVSASILPLMNKQRVSLQVGRSVPYVKDVDVEVAQNAATGDPLPGLFLEGIFLDYKAEIDPYEKEVTLEVRPTIARLKKMAVVDVDRRGGKHEESGNGSRKGSRLGRIMLPELEMQKIRLNLTLRNGATSLVYCPAEAGKETERDLVLLVTVRTAGPDER